MSKPEKKMCKCKHCGEMHNDKQPHQECDKKPDTK